MPVIAVIADRAEEDGWVQAFTAAGAVAAAAASLPDELAEFEGIVVVGAPAGDFALIERAVAAGRLVAVIDPPTLPVAVALALGRLAAGGDVFVAASACQLPPNGGTSLLAIAAGEDDLRTALILQAAVSSPLRTIVRRADSQVHDLAFADGTGGVLRFDECRQEPWLASPAPASAVPQGTHGRLQMASMILSRLAAGSQSAPPLWPAMLAQLVSARAAIRHPGIHPTAVIDHPVEVGEGTSIWHFTHILKGARIGRNCNIGQNVMIDTNVRVGDRCKLQNNVSVYAGVTLEDGVFCGPSMVFTNVVNPRAEIDRKHEIRPTLVRRGATIGANATIVCGHTVGRYALIGAGAVVCCDVSDFALMVGNPARRVGWVCACGVRLPPGLWNEAECPSCRARYRRSAADVVTEA